MPFTCLVRFALKLPGLTRTLIGNLNTSCNRLRIGRKISTLDHRCTLGEYHEAFDIDGSEGMSAFVAETIGRSLALMMTPFKHCRFGVGDLRNRVGCM